MPSLNRKKGLTSTSEAGLLSSQLMSETRAASERDSSNGKRTLCFDVAGCRASCGVRDNRGFRSPNRRSREAGQALDPAPNFALSSPRSLFLPPRLSLSCSVPSEFAVHAEGYARGGIAPLLLNRGLPYARGRKSIVPFSIRFGAVKKGLSKPAGGDDRRTRLNTSDR
jgi:hypothetical protein